MRWWILFIPTFAFGQLSVSTDKLYLQEGTTPVFLNGLGSWDINNLTYAESQRLLDSCASHNINYLQIRMATPSLFGGPANEGGINPWQVTQTFASTPTEAFWHHLDSVIGYAKSKGVYLMLYPDYLGGDATQGWQTETSNSSNAEMQTWGGFVGGRYKDSTNILWGIAGDIAPTTWMTKLDYMVTGIKNAGDTHLMSTRDEPNTTTDTYWSSYSWVDINGQYPYWGTIDLANLVSLAKAMRGRLPVKKPSGLQEAWYEGEHSVSQLQLRQQSYYSFLSGGIAFQIFGNCPNWHFSEFSGSLCGAGDWTAELNSQGMKNQRHFWNIIVRSRAWYKMIPDTSHNVCTAGYSSGNDLAVTSRASDSTSLILYMPTNRQVTLNTNYMREGQTFRAAWLDPADGDSAYIGQYSRSASQNFTPSGSQDWVLVLDTDPPPVEGEVTRFLWLTY